MGKIGGGLAWAKLVRIVVVVVDDIYKSAFRLKYILLMLLIRQSGHKRNRKDFFFIIVPLYRFNCAF